MLPIKNYAPEKIYTCLEKMLKHLQNIMWVESESHRQIHYTKSPTEKCGVLQFLPEKKIIDACLFVCFHQGLSYQTSDPKNEKRAHLIRNQKLF